MYERSARIYDLLYTATGTVDFVAEAERLHALVQDANPGARTLLDVACGTGAHLAELHAHYEVSGVDASEAMLAVARSRLPDVSLHRGDMRTFDLARRFDAVTCLFSSIGYMTRPEDLRAAMRRFAAHLKPGGVLVVEGWLRPDAWIDGHRPPPELADDGNTMVVRLVVGARAGRLATMDMHHLVRTADDVEYYVEHHEVAMVETAEHIAAAESAGLRVVRVEPDYRPGRDRMIYTLPA